MQCIFLSYPIPISSPSIPPELSTQCIPLLTSCPLPVKLELCVCACVWNVVNYHETHQWKKDDLAPSVAIHCQELLVSHPPPSIHAVKRAGLIPCRSCAGSHSCCGFLRAVSCPEDTCSQTPGSYGLVDTSSTVFPECSSTYFFI